MYLVNTPALLKRLYAPSLIWDIPQEEGALPAVYLSFDDGPHSTATPFVLEQLAKYEAKATFFCLGKCIDAEPVIFQQIRAAGHGVGNHTYHHYNGWYTPDEVYLADVQRTEQLTGARAFRPPYGRIRRSQIRALAAAPRPYTIYMWQVLSGDFDVKLKPGQCLRNVVLHAKPGAIIVFHDSTKAWERLRYALPRTLAFFREQGWEMKALPGTV